MNILIVEDDPIQFEFIQEGFLQDKKHFEFKIERIATECEFRSSFEQIAHDRFDVIIMDIMLRWTDPSRNMTMPSEKIEKEGFYRAGFRCIEMLKQDSRTKLIPILVYSVLDSEDLESELQLIPNIEYLIKDFDVRKILFKIYAMLTLNSKRY
jgi:CheY-like chemotaxis protein